MVASHRQKMSLNQNINELDGVWSRMEKITIWLGALSKKPPRIWHRLCYPLWIGCTLLELVQFLWTILYGHRSILEALYASCNCFVMWFLFNTVMDSHQFKKDYYLLFDWCKSLHAQRIDGIREFFTRECRKTIEMSVKTAKYFVFYCLLNACGLNWGPILPTVIFGKTDWRTPLLIALPLVPSVDRWSYLLNTLISATANLYWVLTLSVTFTLIAITVYHIKLQFSIITKMFQVLGEFQEDGPKFIDWFRLISQLHADTAE